jgi:hypothetical protein
MKVCLLIIHKKTVHESIPIIKELRSRIKELEQISVADPLQVHHFMRRKANYVKLLDQLETLQIVNNG